MRRGKRRPDSHIVGDLGVKILKDILPDAWVVREYHPDYGIDLSVELFEQDGDRITTGAHLMFQVKAVEHIKRSTIRVRKRSNIEKPIVQLQRENGVTKESESYEMEVIKYSIDTALLATVERMGSAIPVLLSVVDIATNDIFFICLSDYIEKILVPQGDYTKNASKIINIPTSNILNQSNLSVIEWYAKRPRFYALFNKIRYQLDELQYVSSSDVPSFIDYFIKIIYRFDVWEPPIMIPYMEKLKHDIDYYLANGITEDEKQLVSNKANLGEDVEAAVYESSLCDGLVSFQTAMVVQGLHRLWEQLANLGNIFEDDCKEYFLPTWYWCLINS